MDYKQFRGDIIDELERITSARTFIETNMDKLLDLAVDQEQRIKELESLVLALENTTYNQNDEIKSLQYTNREQEKLIEQWEARSEEYRLELAAALEKIEELETDLVRKDVDYGIIIDKLEDDLESHIENTSLGV